MVSKLRTNNIPLFESKHGKKYVLINKLCRECGIKVSGNRTRWCSNKCVEIYNIRRSPSFVRKLICKRDKKICAKCKLDTKPIQKARNLIIKGIRRFSVKKATKLIISKIKKVLSYWGFQRWWKRKSFWDLDHIIPVADGGGECGLDNYQTLCVKCHDKKTRAYIKSKSKKKK